jgi:predicted amidohydrolase
MNLRAACVAWKIRPVKSDGSYFAHFYDLVSAAHDEGADLVVFPELHVLELLPLARDLHPRDAALYLIQYSDAIESWIERISNSSEMIIVGGSHFRETPEGIKNVSAIAIPGQGIRRVEKNVLTRYEENPWNLARGRGLAKLPYDLGVTIGYDAEFPESARALASSGALIQCVPSHSRTQREFQRVRWSCLARAVENQIFVIHSSLVGRLGVEPLTETYGSSAIIAPNDDPFPTESILRETPLNEEGVVLADLDEAVLQQVRSGSESANWKDQARGDWSVESKDPIVPLPGVDDSASPS